MSTALAVISDASSLPAALGPDLAAAVDLAKAENVASTRKAYGQTSDLQRVVLGEGCFCPTCGP